MEAMREKNVSAYSDVMLESSLYLLNNRYLLNQMCYIVIKKTKYEIGNIQYTRFADFRVSKIRKYIC